MGGLCGSRGPTPASRLLVLSGAGPGGRAQVLPDPHPGPVCPKRALGAISNKQLTYLEKYRLKQRLRFQGPPRAQDQVLSAQDRRRPPGLQAPARLPSALLPAPRHTHHQPSSSPPHPSWVISVCSLPLCPRQCVCVCACVRTAVWSSLPFVSAQRVCLSVPSASLSL